MAKIMVALVLSMCWILWSGMFDAFHLTLGVVSVALVVAWTGDRLSSQRSFKQRFIQWIRFERYCVWLIGQIVIANYHVVRLALHPRPLDALNPKMIQFTATLPNEFLSFLLAQSITLTPGTVTVRVCGDQYTVYTIDAALAAELPGDMLTRVQGIAKGLPNG